VLLNNCRMNSGAVSQIGCLKNLTALDLSFAKLPVAPETLDLRELTSLEYLSLDYTDIGDTCIRGLNSLSKLKTFTCSNTRVGDAAVSELSGLRLLQKVDLSHTDITNVAVSYLGGLTSLKELEVARNEKIDDSAAEYVVHLSSIERLDLHNTHAGDEIVRALR